MEHVPFIFYYYISIEAIKKQLFQLLDLLYFF